MNNDMCRCIGTMCCIKSKCIRHTAPDPDDPYAYISYSDLSIGLIPGIECMYYIKDEQ